jgi:hypothetical protein
MAELARAKDTGYGSGHHDQTCMDGTMIEDTEGPSTHINSCIYLFSRPCYVVRQTVEDNKTI